MNESKATLAYNVEKYYHERAVTRKAGVKRMVDDVSNVVGNILKEVEIREPRFKSSLNVVDGRLEGLEVISPNEYQVVLFLSQMGVFSFVDDGSIPGCASLKLSDGRKRSMSLWVEFITASGYLSARKVRSRFQNLVNQVLEKLDYGDIVKTIHDSTEVQLKIRDSIVVRVTPAFKCTGIWPGSASHWPDPALEWPTLNKTVEVKAQGFNLLSKEVIVTNRKQSAVESDAWIMSFTSAENKLLEEGMNCRRRCLSILKTLRDRHLDFQGSPLNNYHMKTLVLYECEKHSNDLDWDGSSIGDRLQGVLIQLVSCLRCHRLPHYFIPGVDLFASCSSSSLDAAARHVWCLARQIITNSKCFDHL